MNKNQIIARVQAGHNESPEELVFVPLTAEQYKAMGTIHKDIARASLFKLNSRARTRGL